MATLTVVADIQVLGFVQDGVRLVRHLEGVVDWGIVVHLQGKITIKVFVQMKIASGSPSVSEQQVHYI